MECHLMGTTRYCLHNRIQWFPWQLRTLNLEKVNRFHYDVAECRSRTRTQRFIYPNLASTGKNYMDHISWRTISMPVSLDQESSSPQLEDYSSDDEDAPKTSPLEKPLSSDEFLRMLTNIDHRLVAGTNQVDSLIHVDLGLWLKALIADSEREKLIKKLSEANQQNRFLKRQLHEKEGALVNFKSELAVMEQEIQALVAMADEIAKYGIPERSRKINGKYIQSHLLSRLEAVHEKVQEQIKDVDAAESKEVSLFWCGMAEHLQELVKVQYPEVQLETRVQVMGTFDGWSQGEDLSPEYNGYFTKFSTTLLLRPGRYEIKFLVDGEWQLSPEFPIVGEGLMKNNLLIVE
ncbi:unnamed protein product [Camellia sinensis]